MKNIKFIYLKITLLLGFIFTLTVSCERDFSDEVKFASHSATAEIFTDAPIGLGTNFYFPYTGSKATVWSIDEEVGYESTVSMRFDIPNADDTKGGYGGAAFIIDGAPRDLSGYDALTFWAKSSVAAKINGVGFGQNFIDDKFQVELSGGIRLTTNWVKYTIPIPDAAMLVEEKGMFWYSAATDDNGDGYTFWIDELKFEKLGTIAQPQPAIFEGIDIVEQSFVGVTKPISGLKQTFHMANGFNQSVIVAPSYFTFNSTDVDVARVSEAGIITVVGSGTAKISAMLGGVKAKGSKVIESQGSFIGAPIPTQNASNVISIFSNKYTNQPVDYYNGYWAPYQTTLGQDDINLNGDTIIKYSELNFVGIQFAVDVPTINISQMTHFHIDIQVQSDMSSSDFLQIKLQDIGADNAFGTGDDSDAFLSYSNTTLVKGSWVSIDVPLSAFSGLKSRANLAQVVFISDATITDILVDNIYFYKQ